MMQTIRLQTIELLKLVLYFQNETPFTKEYRDHKRRSQTAGWIAAGIFGGVALIAHYIVQNSCSSESDDQRKFRSECTQIVDEALVKACRRHALAVRLI